MTTARKAISSSSLARAANAGGAGQHRLKQTKAIEAAAYLCVQDCMKYHIPMSVIAPPYSSDPPGVSDHRYCTEFLRDGNTHTDVGDNFPWDLFANFVKKWDCILGGRQRELVV